MSRQRQPLDYPDRLDNLQRLLHRLALSQQQLQAAMARFPPGFDRTAFVTAWQSEDPEVRNEALTVRSNADDIHNALTSLLHTAARTARGIGMLAPRPEEPVLDALQREKHLTQAERDSLDLTRATRDRSQHEYFTLHPDDIYEMVTSQVATAPGLVVRISAWIGSWPSPT